MGEAKNLSRLRTSCRSAILPVFCGVLCGLPLYSIISFEHGLCKVKLWSTKKYCHLVFSEARCLSISLFSIYLLYFVFLSAEPWLFILSPFLLVTACTPYPLVKLSLCLWSVGSLFRPFYRNKFCNSAAKTGTQTHHRNQMRADMTSKTSGVNGGTINSSSEFINFLLKKTIRRSRHFYKLTCLVDHLHTLLVYMHIYTNTYTYILTHTYLHIYTYT